MVALRLLGRVLLFTIVSLTMCSLTLMLSIGFQDHSVGHPKLASTRHVRIPVVTMAAEEPEPRNIPRNKRFVLAASYWEKVTMGTVNLYSLLRFAAEWDADVPMPHLSGPWLNGWPRNRNDTRYSLIYNMKQVQKIFLQFKLTRLVDFDLFLVNTSARIFLVNIIFQEKISSHNERQHHRQVHVSKISCRTESKFIKKTLMNGSTRRRIPLRNMTCCRVHGIVQTLPDDIARGCGFKHLSEFTVVFKQWRGITHPDPRRTFRLFVPALFYHNYTSPSFVLPHSRYVIGNATAFISQTIGDEEFIAVHIRTEKLYLKRKIVNDTQCILDTITLATEVSRNHSYIKHVLYFADRFGCEFYGKIFSEHEIAITKFNPGSTANKAFVAQVEQNILSQAVILIVSGGGSFQEAATVRYQTNRNNHGHQPKIYTINKCMEKW